MRFRYSSGQEILAGDRIVYTHSSGEVEFVITGVTGDPSMDWYLTQHPKGCFMIDTIATGPILMGEPVEDLAFVSRKAA